MIRRRRALACLLALAALGVACGEDSGGTATVPGEVRAAIAQAEMARARDREAAQVREDRGPALLSGRAERIDGTLEDLADYRGKVVMVVNTASRCGYTDQFEPLQALYARERPRGLVVLGFPSNDFRQELADDGEVARFCETNYGVSFPMFAQGPVTGGDAQPLFARLAERSRPPAWNFQKYLLDRRGRLAAVFAPGIEPDDPVVTVAVQRLLAERPAA